MRVGLTWLAAGAMVLAAAPSAATAAGKAKKPAPPASVSVTSPPRPTEDQSYLYLSPGTAEPGGAPDYVTRGSAHFNQPWAMTVYDKLGNWPPDR